MKQMALRLDPEMMTALEAAADAAKLSREGYVRQLLAAKLEVRPAIVAQRPWSPTFGAASVDQRVKAARKKCASSVRRKGAQLRRSLDSKAKPGKGRR